MHACSSPVVNIFINDALQKTDPDLNELLLQVITIVNVHPVHALSYPASDTTVKLFKVQSVGQLQGHQHDLT